MDEIALQYYLEDFRKRIGATRTKLGVSTEQMYTALDITRQSLSNFENERGTFKLVNALAISSFFDYVAQAKGVSSSVFSDIAIARKDYIDYIINNHESKIISLCYAWQRKLAPYFVASEYETRKISVSQIKKTIFLDVFSFTNVDYCERLLYFMLRLDSANPSQKIRMFVDDSISDPAKLNDTPSLAPFLNALYEEKQKGTISIHPIKGASLARSIVSFVSGKEKEQYAVLSSNAKILMECFPIEPYVLTIDGNVLSLANEKEVLSKLVKETEEKKDEVATFPPDLLSNLFN